MKPHPNLVRLAKIETLLEILQREREKTIAPVIIRGEEYRVVGLDWLGHRNGTVIRRSVKVIEVEKI